MPIKRGQFSPKSSQRHPKARPWGHLTVFLFAAKSVSLISKPLYLEVICSPGKHFILVPLQTTSWARERWCGFDEWCTFIMNSSSSGSVKYLQHIAVVYLPSAIADSAAELSELRWVNLGKVLYSKQTLQWCHNEHYSVSNLQPHDCLPNHLFRRRSKDTSKLRVTGLCAGNSPVTGEFPAQKASNAETVSIWWRHHNHSNTSYAQSKTQWANI